MSAIWHLTMLPGELNTIRTNNVYLKILVLLRYDKVVSGKLWLIMKSDTLVLLTLRNLYFKKQDFRWTLKICSQVLASNLNMHEKSTIKSKQFCLHWLTLTTI